MKTKALAPFTPFISNVFFTLLEICALKSYENQSIKKSIGRKQANKKGKAEYDI